LFFFLTCRGDSHNDIPLLGLADHPVMVKPDALLRQHGLAWGWQTFESVIETGGNGTTGSGNGDKRPATAFLTTAHHQA
jgi:hypothetical protein